MQAFSSWPAAQSALWALSVQLALMFSFSLSGVQSAQAATLSFVPAFQAMGNIVPVAAEARGAGIVPGKSIDGVAFGDTESQVEKILGKPSRQQAFSNITIFDYGSIDGTVDFGHSNGKVDGLQTFSKKFRTSKGIHVGSALAEVHKAYPKAVLKTNPVTHYPYYELTYTYGGEPVYTTFETHYGTKGISVIEILSETALG
jgi:outer membrane protein assembly factor BamE (lipoprotein component of BamABCDE complex)